MSANMEPMDRIYELCAYNIFFLCHVSGVFESQWHFRQIYGYILVMVQITSTKMTHDIGTVS